MQNDFSKKLQHLRQEKSLTQEELAEILCVSRTAVSKWESGRGYPNIEALKAIAEFFGVTVDFLLSTTEILDSTERRDSLVSKKHSLMVSGLMDSFIIFLMILPLFPLSSETKILCVPLHASDYSFFPKVIFSVLFFSSLLVGIFQLVVAVFIEEVNGNRFLFFADFFSVSISLILILFITMTRQAYAGSFIFTVEVVKFLMTRKVSLM